MVVVATDEVAVVVAGVAMVPADSLEAVTSLVEADSPGAAADSLAVVDRSKQKKCCKSMIAALSLFKPSTQTRARTGMGCPTGV